MLIFIKMEVNYVKLISSGDGKLSDVGIARYGGSTYTLMRELSEEGFRQAGDGNIDCAINCHTAISDLRVYMQTRAANAHTSDVRNRRFLGDISTSFDNMLVEIANKLSIGIKRSVEAAA